MASSLSLFRTFLRLTSCHRRSTPFDVLTLQRPNTKLDPYRPVGAVAERRRYRVALDPAVDTHADGLEQTMGPGGSVKFCKRGAISREAHVRGRGGLEFEEEAVDEERGDAGEREGISARRGEGSENRLTVRCWR